MLLKKIRASGIKGQDFDYELGAGTAIIGPNSAGKTAILEAVKFLCRGKFPEIKKGSWPEATVEGRFDNPADGMAEQVVRSINSKGTVQTGGLTDIEILDIPTLDPEYYFGLTDRERVNYVFSRVKLPADFTVDAIVAEIQRLSLGEKHTEEVETAKQAIIVELRDAFYKHSTLKTESVQEALSAGVDLCRTRFTYWNKRAKETQGAVTTLTELKLRQKEVSAAPADLNQWILDATKEIGRLNSQKGALKQQIAAIELQEGTRKSLEKYLRSDQTDFDALLGRVRTKKKALTDEFEPLNERLMKIDIEDLKRQLSEARIENRKSSEAAAVFDNTCAEIEQAIDALEKQDHCPYCQAKSKNWKETARTRLKEQLKKAKATYRLQHGTATASEALMKDLTRKIESFDKDKAEADELKRLIQLGADEIDRITGEKERDAKKRAEWKEQLAQLSGNNVDIGDLDRQLAVTVTALEHMESNLRELNATRTAETKLQHDLVRAGEAAKEHDLAAAQLSVTKAVGKLLDQKREGMVAEVFNTLLKTANKFTDGILKSPLTLTDGTIGRWDGPTFIEHHWFGGTEKALAYIAISIALSATAPFKLVILDEFGRLDQKNQVEVIKRLIALQKESVIDQFVIAGTSLPKGATDYLLPPGYKLNVIEVK